MIGIAASGGSQKFFLLLGYAKAMRELNLIDEVSLSAGTSAGALLSALLAYFENDAIEVGEDILGGIRGREDIFSFAWSLRGLYCFDPLEKILKENLIAHKTRIEAVTCSVDLLSENRNEVYISNKRVGHDTFIDSILTSSAVPPYVRDLPHRPGLFDGGLATYAPVGYVAGCGVDEVFVLLTSPRPKSNWKHRFPEAPEKKIPWYIPGFLYFIYQYANGSAQNEIKEGDILEGMALQKPLFIVAPKKDLGLEYTDFDPKKLKELVPLGYDLFMEAWENRGAVNG